MEQAESLSKKFKLIFVTILLLALTALVAVAILWNKLSDLSQGETQSVENEVQELSEMIGESLLLPSDEVPVLVTLSDSILESMKGQIFFTNAKVGDKLLIYKNNSKVVLWRPSSEKIIEASLINLNVPTTTQ